MKSKDCLSMELINLSRDILYLISWELSVYDLLNICLSCKFFCQKMLNNDDYWKNRLIVKLSWNINELTEKGNKNLYFKYGRSLYGYGKGNFCTRESIKLAEPTLIRNNVRNVVCCENSMSFIDCDDNLSFYDYDHSGFGGSMMANVKQIEMANSYSNFVLDNYPRQIPG